MNILIAIDSMKGSLTSLEAGRAAAEGIRMAWPDAEIRVCPLADGGEGTAEALIGAMGGERVRATVTGPLGEPVTCEYGILEGERPEYPGAGRIAVMEMAAAAWPHAGAPGAQESPVHYDPGGGRDDPGCRGRGCREFVVGIGGSATNDGGIGMLQALGWDFLDERGNPVADGAAGLKSCAESNGAGLFGIGRCRFRVACDVRNSTVRIRRGQRGVRPAKGCESGSGARDGRLDGALCRSGPKRRAEADPSSEGSGSGGGLGFAFRTFLKADLEPGAKIVLEKTGIARGI